MNQIIWHIINQEIERQTKWIACDTHRSPNTGGYDAKAAGLKEGITDYACRSHQRGFNCFNRRSHGITGFGVFHLQSCNDADYNCLKLRTGIIELHMPYQCIPHSLRVILINLFKYRSKGIDIKHIVQPLTVVGNFNRHAAPKDLV